MPTHALPTVQPMKETTKKILELMFEPNETICVSPDKYGYYSVKQEDLNGDITLISPNAGIPVKKIKESDINLISLNPVSGFRRDENVTAFRSFMVELDHGTIEEQKTYIDALDTPRSFMVFSGNKSLHCGIVLSTDLSLSVWRNTAEWILAIVNKADQQTKNPTRSIRFPDNMRKDGKMLKQSLVEIRGRVTPEDLFIWLGRYPELNPALKKKVKRTQVIISDTGIPEWVVNKIKSGFDIGGRQKGWFCVSLGLAKLGWDEDKILDTLGNYFIEDRDFKEKEWSDSIKSGCKFVERNNL